MNREIKFRAWIKSEQRMIEWHRELFSDMSRVTGYGSEFPSDDEDVVLMQYTGMKDRNGTEVYEGDIVEYQMDESVESYTVAFDDFKCRYVFQDEHANWGVNKHDVLDRAEIIGNIHDNKNQKSDQ